MSFLHPTTKLNKSAIYTILMFTAYRFHYSNLIFFIQCKTSLHILKITKIPQKSLHFLDASFNKKFFRINCPIYAMKSQENISIFYIEIKIQM